MKKLKKEKHDDEKCASIWFPESALDRVDRLASKADITRSNLIRNLTLIGVEYLEASEKVGIFQMSLIMRDFAEWFKEVCDRGLGGYAEKT
jgi:hypothetical protein